MDGLYDLNIGLILGPRHNFVIDTGLGSGCAASVLSYIDAASAVKPLVVVNTHWHWDHIWGNHAFYASGASGTSGTSGISGGCLIVAHEKCRALADESWEQDLLHYARYIDGDARKCLPNLVFTDSISFPGDGVRVFFTPGHTPDGVSVYDETDKVLYAGDNIGDTDDAILPEIDTDAETFDKLLKTYALIDFDICVSGHNKPQGKDVVRRMIEKHK